MQEQGASGIRHGHPLAAGRGVEPPYCRVASQQLALKFGGAPRLAIANAQERRVCMHVEEVSFEVASRLVMAAHSGAQHACVCR